MNRVSPARKKQVKVNVSFDEKTGALRVRPKTIVIKPRKRQEVVWRCSNATAEIWFEPTATPFRAFRWRCPEGGGCLSGVPLETESGRFYKYTVRVLDTGNGAARASKSKAGKKGKAPDRNGHCHPVKEAYLVLE
ncbi:MAG TPA: hypothetical protein VFD58_17895 [Blastocatellia bacterium]|nr:hypothetical protein [Blastocatellia bacterium]